MQEFELKKTVKQAGKRAVLGFAVLAVLFLLLLMNPFVKIDIFQT